mmetsp:Transcript_104141/g.335690  ORF Transcript_104141/g.335690 Transcript_104141/m.335690 type:complete len:81 (-) Transcript_104141:182-424(-)
MATGVIATATLAGSPSGNKTHFWKGSQRWFSQVTNAGAGHGFMRRIAPLRRELAIDHGLLVVVEPALGIDRYLPYMSSHC